MRVLKIVGVDDWQKLPGKTIRVKVEDEWGSSIIAIGNIVKDEWFNPSEEFSAMKEEV